MFSIFSENKKLLSIPSYAFIIDNRKCIGCHACTVACKSEHEVPLGVNRTWVKYIEEGEFPNSTRHFSVMRCNHCEDAPCVDICPTTALYKRDDGIVDFDNERCIGCKGCIQACPYDACYIDPNTNTAAKCNYCTHRVDIGLEPACVNVCPTHAIISGDRDDPTSEIAQLLATEEVSVRKPEKGTLPSLFYINGNAASLTPTASTRKEEYVSSSQEYGVGHNLGSTVQEAAAEFGVSLETDTAQRSYDVPSEGLMWGWEVPAYLVTKAISAGIMMVLTIASLMNFETDFVALPAALLALIFLAITGVLLVMDLDRPDRFLYVLLRPQWKSWLVKGAYIISVYGGLLTLYAISAWLEWPKLLNILTWIILPFALMAGIYTAFLFAQAKARDYWQGKLVPYHMLAHCFMAGAAILTLLYFFYNGIGFVWDIFLGLMCVATAVHLLLALLELLIPHGTDDAKLASGIIIKGKYSLHYWLGVIIIGNLAPIITVYLWHSDITFVVAPVLVLFGVWLSNYLFVRTPQLIPLS